MLAAHVRYARSARDARAVRDVRDVRDVPLSHSSAQPATHLLRFCRAARFVQAPHPSRRWTRAAQAPTKVHLDRETGATAFFNRLPTGHAETAEALEAEALRAISIVSRPNELAMVPVLDGFLDVGDSVLMATSVVHAGPGGCAADGSPRRMAFVTIEPTTCEASPRPSVVRYENSTQYHATQYWWAMCKHDTDRFFETILLESVVWRERGHDLSDFLLPQVQKTYEHWLAAVRPSRLQRV